jgi:hypothetical protein
MSTFYLLPPRPLLGARLADYLETVFPGLGWSLSGAPELLEALCAVASRQPDVYVVHRDDLPEGEAPAQALANSFGAEPGDEVVEVAAAGEPGVMSSRRWQLR